MCFKIFTVEHLLAQLILDFLAHQWFLKLKKVHADLDSFCIQIELKIRIGKGRSYKVY